jgi:hypothetical protein
MKYTGAGKYLNLLMLSGKKIHWFLFSYRSLNGINNTTNSLTASIFLLRVLEIRLPFQN